MVDLLRFAHAYDLNGDREDSLRNDTFRESPVVLLGRNERGAEPLGEVGHLDGGAGIELATQRLDPNRLRVCQRPLQRPLFTSMWPISRPMFWIVRSSG